MIGCCLRRSVQAAEEAFGKKVLYIFSAVYLKRGLLFTWKIWYGSRDRIMKDFLCYTLQESKMPGYIFPVI